MCTAGGTSVIWPGVEVERVPDNATLEEFLSGADAAETDDPADPDGDLDAGADDADSSDDADGTESGAGTNGDDSPAERSPAVSTYRWHPSGVACAACGETATRLWRDAGDLVCAGCKDWSAPP